MSQRIPTLEQAIQEYCDELHSYISDASKSVNGCRTRLDISLMSMHELEQQCDYWEKAVIASIEEDKAREERAIVMFEKLVTDTIKMGASDRDTAIQWISETTTYSLMPGLESLCHIHDLPYNYFTNAS